MKIFLGNTPFFRLVLWYSIGIALRRVTAIALHLTWIILLLFCLIGLFIFLSNKRALIFPSVAYGLLLAFLLMLLGWNATNQYYVQHQPIYNDGEQLYLFRVERFPIERSKTFLINGSVKALTARHTWKEVGDVMLYIQKDSASATLMPGDILFISSQINLPPMKPSLEGFNYGQFLYNNGVMGVGFVGASRWHFVLHDTKIKLVDLAEISRYKLIQCFKNAGLRDDVLAQVNAMALGYRDELSPELKQTYRNSGASHILAVSGLHVAILFGLIAFALRFLKKWTWGVWIQFVITLIALWLYALLTGLSPSVCRAALMFSLISVSSVFKQNYRNYNALFASAFFLLIINPMFLFNVSFILSFSAVLSIFFFYKPLRALYEPNSAFLKWLWDLVTISIAAQIGTFPFVLLFFHQFPLYFWMSSIVAIPTATAILYGSLLIILLSFSNILASAVAKLLAWVVELNHLALDVIAELPGAVWHGWVEWWQWLILMTCMLYFMYLCYHNRARYRIIFVGLICLLVTSQLCKIIYLKSLGPQVLIHDNSIRIYSSSQQTVWTDKTDTITNIMLFNKRFQLPEAVPFIESNQNYFAFSVNRKNYLAITNHPFRMKRCSKPLDVDVLIIGQGVYPNQRLFDCFIKPKHIILLKSVNTFYVSEYQWLCDKNNITLHPIRTMGSWQSNSLE